MEIVNVLDPEFEEKLRAVPFSSNEKPDNKGKMT